MAGRQIRIISGLVEDQHSLIEMQVIKNRSMALNEEGNQIIYLDVR